VSDEPSHRLDLTFEARGVSGSVGVHVWVNTDPTGLGSSPEAVGFPVCQATVSTALRGYSALFGWVQLVGTESPSATPSRFEIDPLRIFAGINMPFGFYGLQPTLFDAPSRHDRQQTLSWLAHAFLCTSPDQPMDRALPPVVAFRWGFRMHGGLIETINPEPLALSTWSRHQAALRESFTGWRFEDALAP
jgi:hypothetical protein